MYAYLAEQADATDRVQTPLLLVNRVDPDRVEELSERIALDRWLNAPDATQVAAEKALLSYLGR